MELTESSAPKFPSATSQLLCHKANGATQLACWRNTHTCPVNLHRRPGYDFTEVGPLFMRNSIKPFEENAF